MVPDSRRQNGKKLSQTGKYKSELNGGKPGSKREKIMIWESQATENYAQSFIVSGLNKDYDLEKPQSQKPSWSQTSLHDLKLSNDSQSIIYDIDS